MTTAPQLPGMKQGLERLFNASPAAPSSAEIPEGEAFGAELKRLFADGELEIDELSPELQALLRQWLAGGAELPQRPAGGSGDALSAAMAAALDSANPEIPGLDDLLAQADNARQALVGASTAGEALASTAGARALPARELLAMPMPQPVGSPPWGGALGERLQWMVKGDVQQVELKISPPNLGPLEVRLTINDDKASVSFVSHHALVRDAIEAALPRLREMLAQESLQLVQAEVGDGARHAPGNEAGSDTGARGERGTAAASADEALGEGMSVERPAGALVGKGLLDLFA
jgi:flagellar hook-length control protein FliK